MDPVLAFALLNYVNMADRLLSGETIGPIHGQEAHALTLMRNAVAGELKKAKLLEEKA